MSSTSIRISAVIITLNEERNIERCIRSLLPVVDEVVVWDAFSTDKTKELCEAMGATVYQHVWEGYSISKNKANEKASGDYILSIDADEEFSEELRQNILRIKSMINGEAYVLTRINNYCGTWIRHSGWYPEYKVRLFKKGTAEWVGDIHEYLEFHEKPKLIKIKGDLLHYSIKSVEHHAQKLFHYSKLTAQKDYQKGVTPNIIFHGILKPAFHFFKTFFLQRGFLDGYKGFTIAKMASFERFIRYIDLNELYHHKELQRQQVRVIQLSSEASWRGGEQQIAYLIDELKKQGIESVALVKNKSNFERYCIEKKIKYYSLPFRNSVDFNSAWRLKRIAKKENASIIHIHSSKSHSIAVLSTLLGLKTPMILSRRVDFELSDTLFSKWKYNHPNIKKIVCVSEAITRIVRPHLNTPEKCITVHSGIDIDRFNFIKKESLLRNEYKINENTIVVGNTSALAGHKDYFTFIDTIDILIKKIYPVSIVGFIIGKGPLERELREYVANKKLEHAIIFTGFRKNIHHLLPSLDYFLITSTEEGLGTSVLDAFASKVPVVATKAGGIPEMVKHEQTGLLAKPKDSTSLADHLTRLIEDSTLRQQLIDNAYTTVLSFSKEKTAQKTIAIYTEILNNNPV